MLVWAGACVLIVLAAVLIRVDARLWGGIITPGVLLNTGYACIALVYALASEAFEMTPISWVTYGVLVFLALLTILVSMSVCFLVGWRSLEVTKVHYFNSTAMRGVLVGLIIAFALPAWIVSIANGGLWSSEAGQALSTGILGHLHNVLAFVIIWYGVRTADRPLIRYSFFAVAILALSLYPVKGWTLIPMVAIALTERTRQTEKSSVRPLLLWSTAIGIFVFFGIYFARTNLDEVSVDAVEPILAEVFAHFVFYLTAGFAGLNAVTNGIELSGGLMVLFAPLFNVVAYITGGQYVNIISDVYVVGLIGHGEGGNVYSMIGSLIAYAGWFGGFFIMVMLLIGSYLLMAVAWRSKLSTLRVAAAYICALFSFGWFEYYFWQLTPYEILVLALTLGIVELNGKCGHS